ncbi:MAG: M23 family metallopeptidase [Microbacteriaceae bacterium]
MRVRRRSIISVAVVAVVAVALACAGCTTGSGGGGSSATPGTANGSAQPESTPGPSDQVSAILVQPMHDAQVVLGSDSMNHVEYNLLVVNTFSDPVTLTGVTVIDPDGKQLGQVKGDTLAAATQTLYSQTPSPVVAASAAVAVEVDLVLPPGPVPQHVSNRITYTLPAGVAGSAIIDNAVVRGPEVEVDRTKATTISPPLTGDGWLATTACCSPNVHRNLRLSADGVHMATAETFAVDWGLVKGNRLYDGDGKQNDQFYDFGAKVLAVADGTVVYVHDGVPESTPFAAIPPNAKEGFGGNAVILKIADGVYAAYEHLQPGSITVHVGDTVKTGEGIGKLGNTGPSQGPHLHFGILDKPDLFVGKSLPFVFKNLTLVGNADLAGSTGDVLTITPQSRTVRNAYPLTGNIVNFP